MVKQTDFLLEGYREALRAFLRHAEEEEVKLVLDQFKQLVNRNQVQGAERNIDWWVKQGWKKFNEFVTKQSQIPSSREIKKGRATGNSINLQENEEWLIVIPLDHTASCFHGRQTDWCVTKPFSSHFYDYFIGRKSTLIFCIQKNTMKKWAIEIETGNPTFFDSDDKVIDLEEFEYQTGLDAEKIIGLANNSAVSNRLAAARKHTRSEFDRAESAVTEFRQKPKASSFREDRDPGLERLLFMTKNSFALKMYLNTMFERWGFQKYGYNIEMLTATILPGDILVFDEPGERILKTAIDSSGGNALSVILQYYDNLKPSLDLILRALRMDGENIRYINSYAPDLLANSEIIQAALNKSPRAIFYISNPTDEMIDFALSRNYNVLLDIPADRVTDERIILALQGYLKTIDKDVMMWDRVARFLSRRPGITLSDNVLEWILQNIDYGFSVIAKLKLEGKIKEFSPRIRTLIMKLKPREARLLFPDDVNESHEVSATLAESRSILLEKRRGKISHPEDLIWQAGYEGYKTAIAALDYAQRTPTSIQIKWDGSPAIIFGRDPKTGELVVTDKAGFGAKRYDGLAKSQKQLFDMIYNRDPDAEGRREYAQMFASLWPLFERAVPSNLRGFYHSDLMYAGVPEVKDGAYQFQQNKIVYRVPVKSELGNRIARSRAGIVVHGFYKDNTQSTPDAVYNTDSLAGFEGLLVIPPMTASSSIKPAKFTTSTDLEIIDQLFNPVILKQNKISDLASTIGKYVNHMAVNGMQDYKNAPKSFLEWLPLSGVHTQKQTRIINHIKNNRDAYIALWKAIANITRIKSYIKKQLDDVPFSDIYPYLKNRQMHEGYVVETPYGLIKLVDRNLFMAKETTNPKFER